MSKKAVYSNKGLQVYITAEDFEILLAQKRLSVPVVIGKSKNAIGLVHVEINASTRDYLRYTFTLECDAIDKARNAAPGGIEKLTKSQMKKKEW